MAINSDLFQLVIRGDAQVQAGAGLMFETRDPVIGTLADSPCYALLAPKDRTQRFVGLLRGTVTSKDATRMNGLVSHQLFYRIDANELIGIAFWHDADAMQKAYASGTGGLHDLFAAKPATSMWKQPTGAWVEW